MSDHSYDDPPPGIERTDVLPPARLIDGKYRLGRLLGEGGMGAVYEAQHVGLGRTVAVKLLGDAFSTDSRAVSRFRREARAAAAIRHQSIVTVFDTGTDEGVPFLVMELLEGESLSAYLRRERVLGAAKAATIARQVLEALQAAHARGVIHRDLKPGNVFLAAQPDGSRLVKILDFGVSKFFAEEAATEVTADGAVIGTPRFMAPEQARGQLDIDARADLYAVGVLLYRMTTGRLPFAGGNHRQIIEKVIEGNPKPPRSINPALDRQLERVILVALAADRRERFQSAEEFLGELERAVPGLNEEGSGQLYLSMSLPTPTAGPSSELSGQGTPLSSVIPTLSPGDPTTRQERARGPRPPVEQPSAGRWRLPVALTGLGVLTLVTVWYATTRPNGTSAARAHRAASASGAPAAETGSPLHLGMTRYLPAADIQRELQPLLSYLSERTKRPVKLLLRDDYVDLGRELYSGRIQLAALAAYSYVRAKRRYPSLELLATKVTAGGKSYEGYVIAKADSGFDQLADLRGMVFCYVGPNSTSGYLYPRALFRQRGIDPDAAFKATRFAGTHLAALRALRSGACDGAAVFAGLLFQARRHGMSPEQFRILASTPRIPFDAYCAASTLPGPLRAQLRKALLALEPGSTLAQRALGTKSRIRGFSEARDSDYDAVRKMESYLDQELSGRDGGAAR